MENRLSQRLETLLSLCGEGFFLADVGSDHGLLSIALLKRGKIKKALLIDNKRGPYERLKKAVSKEGLGNKCLISLSNGLEAITEENDIIVIAGLGGDTIVEIMKSHLDKLSHDPFLVLDAHSKEGELIGYLGSIGYRIVEERIVEEEGIFYDLLKARRQGVVEYEEKDRKFGPLARNERTDVWKRKWERELEALERLREKKLPLIRSAELDREIEMIKEELGREN